MLFTLKTEGNKTRTGRKTCRQICYEITLKVTTLETPRAFLCLTSNPSLLDRWCFLEHGEVLQFPKCLLKNRRQKSLIGSLWMWLPYSHARHGKVGRCWWCPDLYNGSFVLVGGFFFLLENKYTWITIAHCAAKGKNKQTKKALHNSQKFVLPTFLSLGICVFIFGFSVELQHNQVGVQYVKFYIWSGYPIRCV